MTQPTDSLFIDTGSSQCTHFDERICGDVLKFRRIPEEGRLLSVLADGMGHGVKANILATMTATMALKFAAAEREIVHSAEIMMDASRSAATATSATPPSRSSTSVPAAGSIWWRWAIRSSFFSAAAGSIR